MYEMSCHILLCFCLERIVEPVAVQLTFALRAKVR